MSRSGSSRLPSLDGLRAVGIALAVLAHVRGTLGFWNLPAAVVPFYGRVTVLGVRSFFVLSGFLITTLLQNEIARTGTVSLGWFYFRRTLRIFPACYAYLLALAVAERLGWIDLHPFDLFAAATYTTNYHHDRSWYAGHTWSLAVEEQFYLLWPFVLKWLPLPRARQVAIGTILLAPIIRVVIYRFAPALRDGVGESFPTVADALATGCLLALVQRELGQSARYLAFLRGPTFWLAPLAVVLAAAIPSEGVRDLCGETVMNVGLALTIDRFVRFPDSWAGRVLNARPVAFVGTLSYSLYLWQQPFLNRHATFAVTTFPLNVGLAVVCALASYYVVEQPLLRLRGNLERRLRRAMLRGTATASS